ncbi:MAG TPA: type II secretion system F family protein [Candidatus Paceibacterota bacterium]|nr:type II secretion system F family protein [Candidatus Paceibacterota bacterium]
MIFSYKAKLKSGEIIEDTIEAADRFVASRELRSKNLTPISISEKKSNPLASLDFVDKFFSRVKIADLILFTKNLSGMLKAGLSLSRALSVLQKQTKKKVFNEILGNLINEINSGGTLSSGMEKYPKVFSKLFVSMMRAGEESGNLVGSLNEVGSNLEKSHALTKKIKGALTYPTIILSAMILIGVLMFAYVVPTLSKTFTELGSELPASTKFIIFLGNFFSEHLILSLLCIFGIFGGLYFLIKASFMQKYIDYIVVKIPMVGTMVKELNTARTARTMSSLLLSGVTITRSIEITEEVVQNIYYRKILEEAKDGIEKGLPFSDSFEKNPQLYPIMMAEMIQVGEETGKLADMLHEIAIFYEGEIENKTKNLSTIIEPFLMLIIGGAVGFFAISMVSPMYTVMNSIS